MRLLFIGLFLLLYFHLASQNVNYSVVVDEELIDDTWLYTSRDTTVYNEAGLPIEETTIELYFDSCKCTTPGFWRLYLYSIDGFYNVEYIYKWSTKTHSYYLFSKIFTCKRPGFKLTKTVEKYPTSKAFHHNETCITGDKYSTICYRDAYDTSWNQVSSIYKLQLNYYYPNNKLRKKVKYYSYSKDTIYSAQYDTLGRMIEEIWNYNLFKQYYSGADTVPCYEENYSFRSGKIESIQENYSYTYDTNGKPLKTIFVTKFEDWTERLRRKYYYR